MCALYDCDWANNFEFWREREGEGKGRKKNYMNVSDKRRHGHKSYIFKPIDEIQ